MSGGTKRRVDLTDAMWAVCAEIGREYLAECSPTG